MNFVRYGSPECKRSPLLILHGLLGSSKNWATVSKKISDETDRKVFALDLRNHNCTERKALIGPLTHSWRTLQADLESFVESNIKEDKFSLLGHSFGGQVCMSSILSEGSKLRNRVDKMIIEDVSLRHPAKLNVNESDKMYDLMVKMGEIELLRLKDKSEVRKELCIVEGSEEVVNFLFTNLLRNERGEYDFGRLSIENIKSSWKQLQSDWLIANPTPWAGSVLFVKGESSDYIRDDDFLDMKRYFPEYKLEIISKSGHWPHFDNQKEFLLKLNKYLNL